MALFSESRLKVKGWAYASYIGENAEHAYKALSSFDGSKTYNIFLSHSINDKEIIIGLTQVLKEAGFSVYVDWIDDPLLDRSNVSSATALLLQTRMQNCDSLIFAYSNNSPNSKWMPWELGYFNGLKDRVAVVQIVPTDNPGKQFPGQEYLDLYPYIDHAPYTSGSADMIWVNDKTGKYVSYQSWLRTGIIA